MKKLGIKPEMKLLLINQPDDYYSLLEADISDQLCGKNEVPDLIHLFIRSTKKLETKMKSINTLINKNKGITIWVSWYKRSSGIPTDVTEDVIRNFALRNNLVDVKVCAVSEVWSGLKLVVPLNKR